MSNELTVIQPQELVRQSTDIAGLCKEIVVKSAMEIQGRKYVKVEGWQSIATAHGCVASSKDVERVDGGYRAIGEVRRMSDGAIIAQAEGFVGEDEPTWFGGEVRNKVLPKRPDYAIRAMAQTRAISRACRSAFAHVVVLMDAGLSTTPAEEVPHGGFDDRHSDEAVNSRQQTRENAASRVGRENPTQDSGLKQNAFTGDWGSVQIPFGKDKGKTLGELPPKKLKWYQEKWQLKPYNGTISSDDLTLRGALDASMGKSCPPPPPPVDDEIPGTGRFAGKPKLEALHSQLDFESITPEAFIEAAKRNKWVPETAGSFFAMSEETAAKFLDDMDNVIAAVGAK